MADICRSIRAAVSLSSGSKSSSPSVASITFLLISTMAMERAIFSSCVM